MRLPHLLEECSLHGGSLAASIALVDGSPAQRASTSHMLVCMLHLASIDPGLRLRGSPSRSPARRRGNFAEG